MNGIKMTIENQEKIKPGDEPGFIFLGSKSFLPFDSRMKVSIDIEERFLVFFHPNYRNRR
jgi:hypothetical protein